MRIFSLVLGLRISIQGNGQKRAQGQASGGPLELRLVAIMRWSLCKWREIMVEQWRGRLWGACLAATAGVVQLYKPKLMLCVASLVILIVLLRHETKRHHFFCRLQ
ncbi:hypothetical protein ACH5RR_001466 [Cinchona calisaya]|uniref:Uncharacterized protein n=1 Tax=Cinchona calisaya TaxID=153742 RepID=A0ABD3B406_9GENT